MKKIVIINIILLSLIFITEIVFAQGGTTISVERTTGAGLLSGIKSECYHSGQCDLSDVMIVIKNVFLLLRQIAFWVAVGFGIYGGLRLVLSQGSSKNIEASRKIIFGAFIGLMIVYGVSLILNTVLLILTDRPINLQNIWNPQIIY